MNKKMEIRLGWIEQFESGYTTQLDKILTTNEHKEFSNSISELNNFENLKRLYEIVALNNNAFISFTENESKLLLENSLSISGDKEKFYIHHLNLNRLFLNYLSSFRTFLDHTEYIVKTKYGKNSKQSIKYKELTKNLFDNYFSYRFFYKLRNFSQHCGIPIEDFEISATKISENEYRPEYNIEFDAKELLEKFSGWSIVKNDLLKLEKFSIFPLMKEMGDVLISFWTSLNVIFKNDINKSIKYIQKNAGHLKTENNKVVIFSNIKTDENGNLKYFSSLEIPFDIIENMKNYT